MSFTEEVMQAKANPSPDVAPASDKDPAEIFNTGLPEIVEAATQTSIQKDSPADAPKIRIGTEEFSSQEEALKYAAELQLAIAQRDAFEEGKKTASKPEDEVPAIDPDSEFYKKMETKIFEDPAAAIKEINEKIAKDLQKKMEDQKAEDEKQRQAEATRQAVWSDFYAKHSDLSSDSAQQVVSKILERDWSELGPMKPEKALPILAERSRAFIRSLKESQLPTSELQSKTVVTTSSGSPATGNIQQNKASPLDFISQINKHRKRDATINN